jgi:putative drug exporter of the RND superfamily
MRKDVFYRFGEGIYHNRWLVIILWICLVSICVPLAPKFISSFKAIGFTDPHSDSAKANTILNDKLGFSYNQFIIMYHSDKLTVSHTQFLREIKDSLAGLKEYPIKHQIIYPTEANKQISADKHTAYAVVLLKSDEEIDPKLLTEFKSVIKKPESLTMHIGGQPIFLEDTKVQTQLDLFNAEYIATPVAIVTMLFVFGTVVAASLPILLGGICALVILLLLYLVGQTMTLSVFTLNIALLLGLCLSLDYALLIINRYRDELENGHSVLTAIAITQATAGKAVFFSGLAVFISLSALLLFPINVLFSVGIGGLAAVSVAVAVANMLLPSLLAVLGRQINSLRIGFLNSKRFRASNCWRWLVNKVVKRPRTFFVIILLFLIALGYPFFDAKFGFSDFRILPKSMESRQVFDNFKTEFGENNLSPILVLLTTQHKNILTEKNIGHIYDYASTLSKDPRIDRIVSIVNTEPRLDKKQYEMLYTKQLDYLNPGLKELLKNSTNENLTVITVISKYPSDSAETTALIHNLRSTPPGDDLTVTVTGSSVNSLDALKTISRVFPYAFLWIVVFTYLVLLVLLRSLFLPLKAIITAMLSLFASYGMLTLVIQHGYFHELLRFDPQGMLDISLLIIIFCALFGISMDYEVFLLTRIKEYYEKTGDNTKSIVQGIDRSCRIISSAAIIVILICCSFMSADILIVKAFGLGIAVAVFVDAFIIRTMLVPAVMAILNSWNWYLPRWMGKIIPKITFDPD